MLSDRIQKEYNSHFNTLVKWKKTNSSELKEMENEELLNKTKKREKDNQVENAINGNDNFFFHYC